MNKELLDKIPPNSLEAESNLLGSILLLPKAIDEIDLQPEEFYADANKILYRTFQKIHAAGTTLDASVLLQRLVADNQLDRVGGSAYIAELIHSVATAANFSYFASIIREKARLRVLIETGLKIASLAWESDADPIVVLESAERSLANIVTADSRKTLVDAQQATIRAMDAIDAIYRRERTAGLMTGLEEFDRQFGGMFPGELIILAARLGVGKTSLACQWADYTAANGRLVYFGSLEMDASELAMRLLCTLAQVSGTKIRNGTISEHDLGRFTDAAASLSNRTIRFDERPRLRVSDIRRETRRLVKSDLRLVVVDYLQILRPDDSKASRERQVASMAEELKSLARELRVPVLVLAQLNREAVKEGGGGAEHLRESDVIGQAADMVIRIDVTTPKPKKGEDQQPDEYWLRVVKNRNGCVGKIKMSWNPSITTFDSFERPANTMSNREPEFEEYNGRDQNDW